MRQISTLLKNAKLAGTSIEQPAPATYVGEYSLKKEQRNLPNFSNSGNDNSDVIVLVVAVGVILTGKTVSVIWNALHRDKQQGGEEGKNKAKIAENRQIATAAKLQQGYTTQHFRTEDGQTAIAQLNDEISVNPHDAYLYSKRADLRRKILGDKLGAIEDYTKAIHIYPYNALFYLWRSQLYHEIGDVLKAMADYNTAIRLAPDDTMYHFLPRKVNIK
ncbi:tetratricopeptide repeat protein [Iningainema tapete]|uniref:Tetratricopeptide repeat protein n=1 Tax=Iningainema tapete BLCC-T55 TaxID=2748662 RepID=A0A8J6XL06_9CYAN|nr:hypothetical protein [Iningainema tapete]MBD2772791.1 hypothetical protein [Iningainema tapete BLCC-T55]